CPSSRSRCAACRPCSVHSAGVMGTASRSAGAPPPAPPPANCAGERG
ncbi:MAG: hypothetical protein AVDCRST_MAG89-3129, partial [uncultured Gemmatimonadetes bacterium]